MPSLVGIAGEDDLDAPDLRAVPEAGVDLISFREPMV